MTAALATPDQLELIALLERRLIDRAATNLRDYVRYVPIPGVPVNEGDPECEEFYPDVVVPAKHHLLMLNTLERVIRKELRRVMFFLPPGMAKSSYASVVFPPYFMGKRPGSSVIAISYGDELARKFGRRCRAVAKSPEYAKVFGHGLATDNKAVDDWAIGNASQYMCTGALGAVTGHRADGLILDDLIRGREDADSQTIRDKVWEAYRSDHRTRLKPGGWIFYVGTRWHEDDPAGRILPYDYDGRSGWVTARDGEQWFVINLPAKCERTDDPIGREVGEYLWTEYKPESEWQQEEVSQGPRNWSALYQQRPAPDTGTYFQREWLRTYDLNNPPPHLQIYMAADYAVTAGGGDFTVLMVFGIDPAENIYVLDLWRQQASSDVWVDAACDMIIKWRPLEIIEERGQIEKGVGPFMIKRQLERKAYCTHKLYSSSADKATRAQAIRGRVAQGKFYIPETANWVEPLIYEVVRFRGVGDEVDDQVDAMSLLGRRLAELAHPTVAPTREELEAQRIERMRAVAKERPTWDSVVADVDRKASRDDGRIR